MAVAPTVIAVLVGILINNSRLNDLNTSIGELRSDVDRRFNDVDRRFDELDRKMDQRFDDMKENLAGGTGSR